MHEMACENERKLRDNSFKAQYSWVGEMSEALISAEQNGKWGYIDGEGRVVLPFQYKWASDFAEGRAVVVAPSGTYALIDKTGREILPAMYELMEWDAVHGVVKVSYEGVFGLADRNGTEIVPLQYDWMGDTDNSLILVRDEAGRAAISVTTANKLSRCNTTMPTTSTSRIRRWSFSAIARSISIWRETNFRGG